MAASQEFICPKRVANRRVCWESTLRGGPSLVNYRNVLIIIILLSAATWWFLHEDPEAEVRDAHQELSRLLSKTEGAASNTTILSAAVLMSMFAATCEVAGDAEMLASA